MWRERFANPLFNDVHSELNPTVVSKVTCPRNPKELLTVVQSAIDQGRPIAIAGTRHSMGGQQFLVNSELIDTCRLNKILHLDQQKGIVTVQSGCRWHTLIAWLEKHQSGNTTWTIRQKQTGADRLSLGGAVSSNIHSRGLQMKPFVNDLEAIHIITAQGQHERIDRSSPLWQYVVGGYGLFAFIEAIELRLTQRHKLRRRVEVHTIDGLIDRFNQRIADGFVFGDFQFAIDSASEDFLNRGVFSCYEPAEDAEPTANSGGNIPKGAWHYMIDLAHNNKSEAYRLYSEYYLKTDGQVYWSDRHQLTPYLDAYHKKYDRKHKTACKGSEMITELYVPREKLEQFIASCRTELRRLNANVIYGTIRLVEAEDESFLRWASQSWACVIFNLHVDHNEAGIQKAITEFRTLIDLAQAQGGSFFLTYHRWATRGQIERSYPQMSEFLKAKVEIDPNETFQSNWYVHLKSLFS